MRTIGATDGGMPVLSSCFFLISHAWHTSTTPEESLAQNLILNYRFQRFLHGKRQSLDREWVTNMIAFASFEEIRALGFSDFSSWPSQRIDMFG
jgi:hypothetical protein